MVVGLRAFRARLSRNPTIRKGQSFVEFIVLLPVLMIMLSGLVEAGFAINVYLDLVDTAREVARNVANFDPFNDDTLSRNVSFYDQAKNVAEYTLGQAGQIQLDPASDNLIVSVFRVTGSTVTPSERYPIPFNEGGCLKGGEIGWIAFCNSRESKIGTTECGPKPDCIVMADLLGQLVDVPPDTGIVVIEIYYDYDMILGLPWVTAFLPNPITLHAYSFMPNSAAEP